MNARATSGEIGLSKHMKKHRNDVFRLYQILTPTQNPSFHPKIAADISAFLNAMESRPVPLTDLGVNGISQGAVLDELRELYGIA